MKQVYLIRAAQFYKIGISGNVKKRIPSIQTGCPIQCEYIGYMPHPDPDALERELHRRFISCHTFGEWFDLGDDNIRILIAEFNLKFIISPFAKLSTETQRTTNSTALYEARSIASNVAEMAQIFAETYPGYVLNDKGKADIRSLISKFGFECVAESLRHLSSKKNHAEVFGQLRNVCKTLSEYGRHISDSVWFMYHRAKDLLDKDEKAFFIRFVMNNHLDDDQSFKDFFLLAVETPDSFKFSGDLQSVLEFYVENKIIPAE